MLILFGLRSRTSTVGSGMFGCPNERGTRPYVHERARRWFTLFFIPVIPLGTQGEWVRCEGCGASYDPSILAGGQ